MVWISVSQPFTAFLSHSCPTCGHLVYPPTSLPLASRTVPPEGDEKVRGCQISTGLAGTRFILFWILCGHLDVATVSQSAEAQGAWRWCSEVTVRKTHKFFCAWKVKELHKPKVISCDNVQASMGHACTVDISFVCISWPDANDFISQNAVPTGRGVEGDV